MRTADWGRFLDVARANFRVNPYLHGSARWADRRDIKAAGLLGNDLLHPFEYGQVLAREIPGARFAEITAKATFQQGEIDSMGDRVALAEDPVDLPRLPVDDARQDRFRLAALGPREASRRLDTNVTILRGEGGAG